MPSDSGTCAGSKFDVATESPPGVVAGVSLDLHMQHPTVISSANTKNINIQNMNRSLILLRLEALWSLSIW